MAAQLEAVRFGRVDTAEQAADQDDFRAKATVHHRLGPTGGVCGLSARGRGKNRRGQRSKSERAHGQLRARLEVAMRRSPKTVASEATRNPPAARAIPMGPT